MICQTSILLQLNVSCYFFVSVSVVSVTEEDDQSNTGQRINK